MLLKLRPRAKPASPEFRGIFAFSVTHAEVSDSLSIKPQESADSEF